MAAMKFTELAVARVVAMRGQAATTTSETHSGSFMLCHWLVIGAVCLICAVLVSIKLIVQPWFQPSGFHVHAVLPAWLSVLFHELPKPSLDATPKRFDMSLYSCVCATHGVYVSKLAAVCRHHTC